MTINSEIRTAGPYLGNNTATTFAFAFKVFGVNELLVVRANSAGIETNLTLGPDYTATLNADQDNNQGGSVTLPAELSIGLRLRLSRVTWLRYRRPA